MNCNNVKAYRRIFNTRVLFVFVEFSILEFSNQKVAFWAKVSCSFPVIKGDPKVTKTTDDPIKFANARNCLDNDFFLAIYTNCTLPPTNPG